MNIEETVQKPAIQKTVSVLVGAILGACLALIPFYYSTNNRLDNIEKQTIIYDEGLRDIQDLKLHPIRVNAKLDNIGDGMKNMKEQIKLVYERQEKTYDLILKERN